MVGESIGENRRIRILFMITSLQIGGAEAQFVHLVTRLDRERFEPAVCCLAAEGPYREALDAAGIPVVTIGFTGFWGMRRDPGRVLGQLLRLFKYMRAFRPDVVHGFLYWAYVIGALTARVARVPVVVGSRRNIGNYKASRRFHLFLERIANGFTNVVIANSEAVRQDTIVREHLRPEKVGVIYNGIEAGDYSVPPRPELRESLGLVDAKPVVGVVAIMRGHKGHDLFLDAWSVLVRRYPKAVALFVGDGPVRAQLETLAGSLGVKESVRFLGTRNDVPDVLALMDLLVHPSREEGLSNAVLEAMAAGKPVITTEAGGNAEAVIDGKSGIVVPSGDSQALLKSMLRVVECPEHAAAMARAGEDRVSKLFAMPVMVQQYEQLYERLTRERNTTAGRELRPLPAHQEDTGDH